MPDHSVDEGGNVIRIGAPLVEPLPPTPGSVAADFLAWMEIRRGFVQGIGWRVLRRFGLDVAFCSINFDHPEYGPASRVAELVVSPETDARFPHAERHRRRARVMNVPHSAMGDCPSRWERGETVLLELNDMGEQLGRRFEASAVIWSLSAPLSVPEEWFGLFGVASLARTPPPAGLAETVEAGAHSLVTCFLSDAGDADRGL